MVVVRRHAWRPSPERRGYGGRSFARASDSPPTRSTVSCTRAGGSRQLVLRGVPCADRAGRFASLCGLTAALCPHSMPLSHADYPPIRCGIDPRAWRCPSCGIGSSGRCLSAVLMSARGRPRRGLTPPERANVSYAHAEHRRRSREAVSAYLALAILRVSYAID